MMTMTTMITKSRGRWWKKYTDLVSLVVPGTVSLEQIVVGANGLLQFGTNHLTWTTRGHAYADTLSVLIDDDALMAGWHLRRGARRGHFCPLRWSRARRWWRWEQRQWRAPGARRLSPAMDRWPGPPALHSTSHSIPIRAIGTCNSILELPIINNSFKHLLCLQRILKGKDQEDIAQNRCNNPKQKWHWNSQNR